MRQVPYPRSHPGKPHPSRLQASPPPPPYPHPLKLTPPRDCFLKFISSKTIKHLGALGRLTRPPPPSLTRHYTLALSLGPSSTALLHLLHSNLTYSLTKNRAPPFHLQVVHIINDSTTPSPATDPLTPLRPLYPPFTFLPLPLSTSLSLPTIDFSALPPSGAPSSPPALRLRTLLSGLPSAASRADVLRLLTRHLLLHAAREAHSQALLFGHSTTALAELTLSEAAKGRGFGVPWVVSDGAEPEGGVVVSHPLREVLRGEVVRYGGLVEPRLVVLEDQRGEEGRGAVVSHRDLSIDEVMRRYFGEVEERYPAVVANVARTTGKLVRMLGGGEGGRCGVCGTPLDGEGDERWRGELGVEGGGGTGEEGTGGGGAARLCYGCERSTRG